MSERPRNVASRAWSVPRREREQAATAAVQAPAPPEPGVGAGLTGAD